MWCAVHSIACCNLLGACTACSWLATTQASRLSLFLPPPPLLVQVNGLTIRLMFNKDKNWTRALKHMLVDLKFVLKVGRMAGWGEAHAGGGVCVGGVEGSNMLVELNFVLKLSRLVYVGWEVVWFGSRWTSSSGLRIYLGLTPLWSLVLPPLTHTLPTLTQYSSTTVCAGAAGARQRCVGRAWRGAPACGSVAAGGLRRGPWRRGWTGPRRDLTIHCCSRRLIHASWLVVCTLLWYSPAFALYPVACPVLYHDHDCSALYCLPGLVKQEPPDAARGSLALEGVANNTA